MPDSGSLPELKISELPVASSATGTDQIEANQAGVTRSITVAQIAALSPPPDLSDYVTDEELAAAIGAIPPPPTTLPPSGAAGGDLTGFYPNPTIKPGVIPPPPTIPVGKVAYGGTGGVLTGDTGFAWDHTNQRLGVGTAAPGAAVDVVAQANTPAFHIGGYSVTGSSAVACFAIDAALDTTGQPDIFRISFSDTSDNGGAAFVINFNSQPVMRVSYDGLFSCGNGSRFFANTAVPAPASSWGQFVFNGAGGNLGTYFGAGSPVGIVNTFGRPGSLYYNGAAPGLPYYNSDGATAWDRMVGETATQTLTNKTFAPASISPGSNGQVMTTVSGAAAWAAASGGGASITVSDTPPGSPTAGALWWNSVLGTMFIYYNDGNSTQWVPAAPSAMTAWPGATGGQTFLAADVALNATGTVFSILNTGSIGAAGQVFDIEVSGAFINPAGGGTFDIGIFDGTSYLVANRASTTTASQRATITLSVRVTLSAATTFTLRSQDVISTASVVAASAGSPFGLTNHSTYIKWTRVA